jgi:preprotein translocase subunit SecE
MLESPVKNKISSPSRFVNESVMELKKVVWPNRQQVVKLTLIVIGVSIVTGILIGGLDYLFTGLFGLIIK